MQEKSNSETAGDTATSIGIISSQQAEKIIEDKDLAEEDLLDELENGDIPHSIREARLSQLKKMSQDFSRMKDREHGKYTEILEEKSFLDLTTSVDRCVVHFFHPDFRRCEIMHNHLAALSEKHFETKFAKISVEKAKFFVTKLQIQVLPAVICFIKGIVVDRIIGFDDLGNSDDFLTSVLEQRLMANSVISGKQKTHPVTNSIFGRGSKKPVDSDSSDDD